MVAFGKQGVKGKFLPKVKWWISNREVANIQSFEEEREGVQEVQDSSVYL